MDKEFRRISITNANVVLSVILFLIVLILFSWIATKSGKVYYQEFPFFVFFIFAIFYPLSLIIRKKWPLLAVKGDILYVARYGYWKPKAFPFTNIDNIKIIRWQNPSIGKKDHSNHLVIEYKNGKIFKTNLYLRTEKQCKTLDAFLGDALPNTKVEIEFHNWKENWS